MNNNYLNEEKYQETKGKLNRIANILLFVGGAMIVFGAIMAFGAHRLGFFALAVIGLALVGFGAQAKMLSHGREIAAYMAQQQIPIAKEGVDQMAPSMGKAAKEITKGIKEGLKDEK